MDKQIQLVFNTNILEEVLLRFNIEKEKIKLLGDFNNYIYEFEKDRKNYILRIGHNSRKSESLIQAEVDWINYLADNGAGIHRAIYSENNKLVEHINDNAGGHFLATVFTKASGGHPWEKLYQCSDEEYYMIWGREIGKLHALSKKYTPVNSDCLRPAWDSPVVLKHIENGFSSSEPKIHENYNKIKNYLSDLPKDMNSFGLIHTDMHEANFFIDLNNNITFFDFDDCHYNWFINDIAIILFNKLYIGNIASFTEYMNKYFIHFLHGYKEENKLDIKCLKEIPHFMKFRESIMYVLLHSIDKLRNFDKNFIQGRKYRLENDIPVIDFDFESLTDHLK